MFHVGQKVECINVVPIFSGDMDGLACGRIYTVRWVGRFRYPNTYKPWEGPAIKLHEIIRPNYQQFPDYSDMPYAASRFRPVVERKTDISIFTRMLTPETV